MGTDRRLLIPLGAVEPNDEQMVGGKAAKLGQLAQAGFRVPNGFCVTAWAYEMFLEDTKITTAIRMELGRKPMDEMRWEEIWDAALRIRASFLAHSLPDVLRDGIADAMSVWGASALLAVRSSAIGEDSAGRSFAGLHESKVGVQGVRGVEDAVRLVWASLWSDSALLYRKELGLDPARSRMAVLVQEMIEADRSGVAFARDPRDARKESAIIESVPGPCSLLVDGLVDPDRWEVDRTTRGVVAWVPGQRDDASTAPLLEPHDLATIMDTLLSVEKLFQWAPDMEWTGRSEALTVLQARPITTSVPDEQDERRWYLSLRPGDTRLKKLRKRVAEQLIPELEAEGRKLAAEDLDRLSDQHLSDAITQRREAVSKWKEIYWDEFIPFAHGVRRLATYYNDAVQPNDPYEFVELLRDQPLLAAQRNHAIGQLAQQLASNSSLRDAVQLLLSKHSAGLRWPAFRDELAGIADGAAEFVRGFEDLNERYLDIAYDQERLHENPEPLLRNIVELSRGPRSSEDTRIVSRDSVALLEQRLLAAVGPQRRDEALEVIETGRVSWKLRDDDNLLVARLESQLLRALEIAAKRLRDRGRLRGTGYLQISHAELLATALRDPSGPNVTIESSATEHAADKPRASSGETPRQLIGQPASPGVATGLVRCIRGREDLGKFHQGEVLVCDAIQPTMTHLVPLASAIIERRGGMLIHGAIIARELGIPCVNGVRHAAEVLNDGDLVTVDGHLGIVAVGDAEFDLEFGISSSQSG
jgi:pyruvate,water dikinase